MITRFPYTVGAVGTAGAGAIGVGTWQVSSFISSLGESNPLFDSRSLYTKTGESSGFSFKSFGCFVTLFPGATVGTTEETNNESGLEESKLKVTPSVSSESTTFGCSLFYLEHDLRVPKWILKTEISFRNENVGWHLWVEGRGSEPESGQGYSQKIGYRLTLLEKEDSNWKVKGGYVWEDKGVKGNSGDSLNIHVKVGWEKDALLDEANSSSAPKKDSATAVSKSYERIGREKAGGKGIFEEIQMQGKKESNYEILGRTGNDFETNKDKFGYSLIERAYDVENSKWIEQRKTSSGNTTSFDLSKTLRDWYKPFESKKGEGVDMKGYCEDKETNGSSNEFAVICKSR